MTLIVLMTYATALIIAAAIPGPGMTALVARALGSNFLETFCMGLGLIAGDLFYLTAVILGLSIISQTFHGAFVALKVIGAIYLLYIAWKLWSSGFSVTNVKANSGANGIKALVSGLLISLGNPKTMLFYVALVPTIIDLRVIGIPEFVSLAITTFVCLLIVILPYIALASKARDFLKNPKKLKLLNRFAATILAGTATTIMLRSN